MYTILLVEDQPEIRDVLGLLLNMAGYNVILASNGKEGLALAASISFDLVITDMKMPFMDGNELVRELGHIDNPPPVIALAGNLFEIEPHPLIKATACKPITTKQLKELINKAIGDK